MLMGVACGQPPCAHTRGLALVLICYATLDETAPASPGAAKPDPAVPVGAAVTAIGFGQYPLGVGQVKYLQQVRCAVRAACAVPIISAPRMCTSTPFQTRSNKCLRLYLILSATTAGRAGPAQQPLPEPMRCRSCIPASCILLLNAGRAEPAQQHRVY